MADGAHRLTAVGRTRACHAHRRRSAAAALHGGCACAWRPARSPDGAAHARLLVGPESDRGSGARESVAYHDFAGRTGGDAQPCAWPRKLLRTYQQNDRDAEARPQARRAALPHPVEDRRDVAQPARPGSARALRHAGRHGHLLPAYRAELQHTRGRCMVAAHRELAWRRRCRSVGSRGTAADEARGLLDRQQRCAAVSHDTVLPRPRWMARGDAGAYGARTVPDLRCPRLAATPLEW